MSVAFNAFANMPADTTLTQQAAQFIGQVSFADIPKDALHIGKRCMIDGLGLYVAGSEEHSIEILIAEALEMGGRNDAACLGASKKVPAPMAARFFGHCGPCA